MGSHSLTLATQIAATREQASSQLVDEVVILSLKNGTYYGLNSVGARVWAFLEQPRSIETVRDMLLEEYDVEPVRCESELFDLLTRLAEEDLIEVVNANSAPST